MSSEPTDPPSARGLRAHAFFLKIQDEICDALTALDGHPFQTDSWDRPDGGGGRTRMLIEGSIFEKAGVGVSAVFGELPEAFARELPGVGRHFFATGMSLVFHPRSAHVPTVHANFRYLEKWGHDAGAERVAWYGGGADLTPWILYPEDAVHFHRTWRDLCVRHPIAPHPKLKAWCDEYFQIVHRGERRGIGGIFFDYLGLPDSGGTPGGAQGMPAEPEAAFAFVSEAASHFLSAYLPIVERRLGHLTTEEERSWQLIRRGRYVEFNLVYDRGTTFGLKTQGRIESILMSLPSLVRWGYDEQPRPGTYQEALVEVLRAPREWLTDG